MIISPQLKDIILSYIISAAPTMRFAGDRFEIATHFNTTEEVIKAILVQFHSKGFIHYTPFRMGKFQLEVKAEAHDYILKGGHLGEFEFLEMQVQRLKNDLIAFEGTIPQEKYTSMLGTINTILSAASAYAAFK